jgi:hypothetical protein
MLPLGLNLNNPRRGLITTERYKQCKTKKTISRHCPWGIQTFLHVKHDVMMCFRMTREQYNTKDI